MSVFHQQIRDRIGNYGDMSDGVWNLIADILEMTSYEAMAWTHRADDAVRIPDMIMDAVRYCRIAGGAPQEVVKDTKKLLNEIKQLKDLIADGLMHAAVIDPAGQHVYKGQYIPSEWFIKAAHAVKEK